MSNKIILAISVLCALLLAGLVIVNINSNHNKPDESDMYPRTLESVVSKELKNLEREYKLGEVDKTEYIEKKKRLEEPLLSAEEYTDLYAERYLLENPNATAEELADIKYEAAIDRSRKIMALEDSYDL